VRNMSFSLTSGAVLAHRKTVTRRLGWTFLKPGALVQAVVKCRGLRKGERVRPLATLRITDVRREPLRRMTDDPAYGRREIRLECFGEAHPADFVSLFCGSHRGSTPDSLITRIAFVYVDQL